MTDIGIYSDSFVIFYFFFYDEIDLIFKEKSGIRVPQAQFIFLVGILTPTFIVQIYFVFKPTPNSFLLARSNNKYITGTITKVKKVAKNKPKMTVQAIGPQKSALLPPI